MHEDLAISAVTQAHTSQCGLNGELRVETLGSRGQCSGTLSDYNSATCQFESYLTLQLTGKLLLHGSSSADVFNKLLHGNSFITIICDVCRVSGNCDAYSGHTGEYREITCLSYVLVKDGYAMLYVKENGVYSCWVKNDISHELYLK